MARQRLGRVALHGAAAEALGWSDGGATMSFILLIVSNLLRQKIRTGLTVIGMSIGITAVVALGIITKSVGQATSELLRAGGSDFSVGRSGSADLTFSTLTNDDVQKVLAYPEVEHVTPVILAISKVGSNPFFAQVGLAPEDLAYFRVPLVDGRELEAGASNEVMLGSEAADQLGAELGDTVEVRDVTFSVVGIYRTGTTYLDGGAVLPIATVQEYERKQGLLTLLFIKTKPGTDVQALTARIEADHADLATLADLSDVSEVDQGLEILDAVNLALTILAVFIGGIAVMNTMVMAVFERTREFGILRALGWRTRRILQMVLGESLLLCLVAAVVGSGIAVLLTKFIVLFPAISAFISPVYTYDVFLRGLAVGFAVAIVGALYPAYRAASFSPAQAIRYE
jgi:putative ABC transport system permease protein